MARPVRYHAEFAANLRSVFVWLRAHRPVDQRVRFGVALAAFSKRVAANAALGVEVERRGARSYRVSPIGGRLPYLVWYRSELGENTPIWLLMLTHEAQDRARFTPEEFD